MKKIAFITLLDVTKTQTQLAESLSLVAESWFVISTKKDKKILKRSGINDIRILDLSITRKSFRKFCAGNQNTTEILTFFEDSRLPYSSILAACRMINSEPIKNIDTYIAHILVKIEVFLNTNKIEWVFAEPSDLIQLLTQLVCWKIKINFAQITLARHPNNRLILMSDCMENNFYYLNNKKLQIESNKWLQNFRNKTSKPSYFQRISHNRSLWSLTRSLYKRKFLIIKEIINLDELHSLRSDFLIKQYLRNIIRNYFISKKNTPINLNDKKYVAYFLHVQPERSIDVIAPYFTNQLELIKLLRKCLPWNIKLIVKDHPANDGAQPLAFYRELKKIKNIELVGATTDSKEIILNSLATVSVTGTASYEAALLKIPAIVFTDLFFSKIPGMCVYKNINSLKKFISKVSNGEKLPTIFDDKLLNEYLTNLIKNSVETDWDGVYDYLSSSTINSMTQLILSVWDAKN